MNPAKLYAQVFGVVLTLVGIIGFIPAFSSPATGVVPAGSSLLLGIFAINPLHNVIHLATGLLGLAAGFAVGGRNARLYALVFGVVYALVTVLGLVEMNTILGLIPINLPDTLLHAGLAILGLAAYAMSQPSRMNATA